MRLGRLLISLVIIIFSTYGIAYCQGKYYVKVVVDPKDRWGECYGGMVTVGDQTKSLQSYDGPDSDFNDFFVEFLLDDNPEDNLITFDMLGCERPCTGGEGDNGDGQCTPYWTPTRVTNKLNSLEIYTNLNQYVCGNTEMHYHKKPGSASLQFRVEVYFQAPSLMAPQLLNQSGPYQDIMSICSDEFTLESPKNDDWITDNVYNWQVQHPKNGEWVTFDRSMNDNTVATSWNAIRDSLNAAVEDYEILGEHQFEEDYYIRVGSENTLCIQNRGPRNPTTSFYEPDTDRTSNRTLLAFAKKVPSLMDIKIQRPTCSGKADASIEVSNMFYDNDQPYIGNHKINYSLKLLSEGEDFPDRTFSSDTTTYTIDSLEAGKWRLSYENEIGTCSNLREFTIPKAYLFQQELTDQSDPLCYSSSDGLARLQLDYQVPPNAPNDTLPIPTNYGVPYRYLFNGEEYQPTNGDTTHTPVFDLPSGTYDVLVLDQNDCYMKDATISFTLTDPEVLTLQGEATTNYNGMSISCTGLTDGMVQLTAGGGVGAYIYSLGDKTQAEGTFTELGAGMYGAIVEDDNGCVSVTSMTLTEPLPLEVNAEVSDFDCSIYDKGKIEVTAKGGIAPYTYQLEGVTGEREDALFEEVDYGDYQMITKDQNGCEVVLPVIITNPGIIHADLDIVSPSCKGSTDGAVTITHTGGIAPFEYALNHAEYQTENSFTALPQGDHLVTLKDARGCLVDLKATVQEPAALGVRLLENEGTCFNEPTGYLEVEAVGGTGTYTYQWSTGATTPRITDLTTGRYDVMIEDMQGCSLSETFEVTDMITSTSLTAPEYQLCIDETLELGPLVTGAQHWWYMDSAFLSNSQTAQITEAGSYMVKVSTPGGCKTVSYFDVQVSKEEVIADFLMLGEANVGDTVIVVDISWPLPDTIGWQFNQEAEIIYAGADYAEVVFQTPGTYEIGVWAGKEACTDQYSRTITIIEGKERELNGRLANDDLIQSFKVYPNPTDGEFKVEVTLSNETEMGLQVIDLTGNQRVIHEVLTGSSKYQSEYNLAYKPGLYMVIINAGGVSKTTRLIIK